MSVVSGTLFSCIREAKVFKCTKTDESNFGVCYAMDWVNDGLKDCEDASDERKLRIGNREFLSEKPNSFTPPDLILALTERYQS